MLKVLVVEPASIQVKQIEYTLGAMQDIVGGHLKDVLISNKYVLIHNIEGEQLGLPANDQCVGFRVHGTFFIARIDVDSTFISLTDEEIDEIKEHFIRKEAKVNV
jgi:hypothetical protein